MKNLFLFRVTVLGLVFIVLFTGCLEDEIKTNEQLTELTIQKRSD